MPGNLEVAHVAQELSASDQLAIEFVLDGDVELRAIEQQIAAAEAADDGAPPGELYGHYAAIGGYDARSRAATLMHGLGFTTERRTTRRARVLRRLARAPECRAGADVPLGPAAAG